MTEWRTIDTGPTDGTLVDIWVVNIEDPTDCRRYTDAFFQNGTWWRRKYDYEVPADGSEAFANGSPPHEATHRVTHWMPRPVGPSGEVLGDIWWS